MDHVGAFLEEEWESLNKMFSCEDSDSFWRHLEVTSLFTDDQNVPGVDAGMFLPSSSLNTNFNSVSQESSQGCETDTGLFTNYANGVNFPQEACNDSFQSMNFYTMDETTNNTGSMNAPVFTDEAMEEILQLKAQLCIDQTRNVGIHSNENGDSYNVAQLKRKYEAAESQSQDQSDDKSSESPKKKPRAPRNAPKSKRNVQPRKKKAKEISNNEEESNGTTTSENDSNASQELIEGSTSESKDCVNTSGKARAGRGSATDPQSLYARKRRERINERLRILQNLVPNGTKVDISTMLEEAVQYVKFLQLQIKLLSSDDTWMYAPIAYNGMDMGLYQRMILPNLLSQN